MAGSPRDALHRIIREDPGVFARAARVIGIPFVDVTNSRDLSNDPTAFYHPRRQRVDALLGLSTAEHEDYLLAVVAMTAVTEEDRSNPVSWTYYLSYLHASYRMPPVLLIVCGDRHTANWAARHLDAGPKAWTSLTMRPIVLGPDTVPLLKTRDEVAGDIPMTVLSAILHQSEPDVPDTLEALSATLRDLHERDATAADRYIELTAQGLATSPHAAYWRALVHTDTSFFVSPLAEELREEGRVQGREEGHGKGREAGKAAGIAMAVLRILHRRDIPFTHTERGKVFSCTDLRVLEQWFDRAITATTTADVFDEA